MQGTSVSGYKEYQQILLLAHQRHDASPSTRDMPPREQSWQALTTNGAKSPSGSKPLDTELLGLLTAGETSWVCQLFPNVTQRTPDF